jgi:hypothetical protein
MKQSRDFFHHPFFIRLFNWEYWSFNAVYLWVIPWWFWLAIRARSFFFFNASNPCIENGGFLNESKKDIHLILPEGLYPRSIHFSIPADPNQVWEAIHSSGMQFPLMGKPDIGGRGRGVKKLCNRAELDRYVSACTLDFHIQAYIPFSEEVGIFYHRYPNAKKGKITGIVRKEFLSVRGDGRHTVRELLAGDKRGIMYLQNLERILGDSLDEVPADGETKVVSPYGNHARGSLFLDETYRADERLHALMDRIADQIPGFHFGRLDIRYRAWEAFVEGRDFSIIELNGAGAEPTHMYDPRHSIFFAWKEITRHWTIMQRISAMNHARGIPYLGFREGRAVFRKDKEISKRLSQMPE